MRTLGLTFSFLVLSSYGVGEIGDDGTILRYRRFDSDPCALALEEEAQPDFPEGSGFAIDDQWQSEIDQQLDLATQYIEGLKDSQNLRKLARIQVVMEAHRDRAFQDLRTLSPGAYSDRLTRDRWKFLVGKGYRFASTKLKDLGRLGSVSEFAPAVADPETRAIRLNFLFKYDPWIESIHADDIIDPDIVVVQQIAFAYYAEHTLTLGGEFRDPNEKSFNAISDLMSEKSGFMNQLAAELPIENEAFRQVEAVSLATWQLWYFIGQKFALNEALRFFQDRPLKSSLYEQLLKGTEKEQIFQQKQYFCSHWAIHRGVVETFWDDADTAHEQLWSNP